MNFLLCKLTLQTSVTALPTEHCQTDEQPAAMCSDFIHSGKFFDMDFIHSGEFLDIDAKQRLEKVDERLTCAVCLRRYQDPRMLYCRHSFCRECLVDMVAKQSRDPQYPLGVYLCCTQEIFDLLAFMRNNFLFKTIKGALLFS